MVLGLSSFVKNRIHNFSLLLVLGIHLLPRLYVLWTHGPFTEPDSPGYRTNPNSFGFTNDLAKIDIFGNAFRPFPVNLLYAIGPNDYYRVFFQIILGAFAWLFFQHTMMKRYRDPWLPLFFVCIFSLNPGMIYRDLTILPDSIAFYLIVIIFSLLLTTKVRSLVNLALLFCLSLILVIQRPTLWVSFLTAFIVSVIFILIEKNRILFVLATFSFILTLIGAIYNLNQSTNAWPKYFDTKYPVTKNAFPIGLLIWEDNPLRNEWLKSLERNKFPRCGQIESLDSGPWEYSVRVFGECKEASEWLNRNFYLFFVKTAIHEPTLVINQLKIEFPKSFVPSPDPYVFEKVSGVGIFPKFPRFELLGLASLQGLNYTIANNPIIFWSVIFLYMLFRYRKCVKYEKQSLIYFCFCTLFFMVCIIANNLVMPSDTFRHNIPANMGLLLGSYYFICQLRHHKVNEERRIRRGSNNLEFF